MPPVDVAKTDRTRARYDRVATFYDLMQRGMERSFAPWRAALWKAASGPRILEVGAGTGQSMPYYPRGAELVAIDLSPRMLDKARKRAREGNVLVTLREADVQALPFPGGAFDTVVAACVFCSVPDPMLGLAEVRRVLAPGGQLLMLEHVLSRHFVARPLMQLVNPFIVRTMGANINRDTVSNVRLAGFVEVKVADLWLDIMKQVSARAPR